MPPPPLPSVPSHPSLPSVPSHPSLPAAIEVTGLHKSYGRVHVLRGIDLSVAPGSVFALLGPNGAGKTTAVRILATLSAPDTGTVRVLGRDVLAQRSAVRRDISLTGQFAAVDETQTGAENLRMMARLTGRSRAAARARAAELLDRFDLADAASRLVRTYSGGMRRRLDLAAGLVGDPRVIFLDEPTTGLDPRSRSEMWQVVRELCRGGTTVFLTTQYLEEADQLADRIAVLNAGRIVADGTADALKSRVAEHRLDLTLTDPVAYARLAREAHETGQAGAPGAGEALGAGAHPAVHRSPDTLTLGFPTDGTAPHVRALLDALDPHRTDVASFTVRSATLDDVFLALTRSPDADTDTGPGTNTGTAPDSGLAPDRQPNHQERTHA